jgi:xanthine dehydrogenase small subunit
LSEKINAKPETATIPWLVEHNFIPVYFLEINSRLLKLKEDIAFPPAESNNRDKKMMLGGATDLMVQKQREVHEATIDHLFDNASLKKIYAEDQHVHVGASVTVTEFAESKWMQQLFPGLSGYIKLVSSTPVRNMATLGGNLVNASPIGDMSIFFLALDSKLILNKNGVSRKIKLKDFYKSYKQIDKDADEILEEIIFKIPDTNVLFNFEKVSKRTWLDIASVNSACQMKLNGNGSIEWMHLSAGGVAPFPKYLSNTVSFLTGKNLSVDVFREAVKVMNEEIAPISDARGTSVYKALLLRQLFTAHLVKFFGQTNVMKEILTDIRNQHTS